MLGSIPIRRVEFYRTFRPHSFVFIGRAFFAAQRPRLCLRCVAGTRLPWTSSLPRLAWCLVASLVQLRRAPLVVLSLRFSSTLRLPALTSWQWRMRIEILWCRGRWRASLPRATAKRPARPSRNGRPFVWSSVGRLQVHTLGKAIIQQWPCVYLVSGWITVNAKHWCKRLG